MVEPHKETEQIAEQSIICVKCGIEIDLKDFKKNKSSVSFPFCSSCFKKVWNNDYNKYLRYSMNVHG